MNKRTPGEWIKLLTQCGVTQKNSERWAPIFSEFFQGKVFSLGDTELPDFLSQILHESSRLSTLEENLRYSIAGMRKTWPARFPTDESARPYEYNPVELACKVYNGRLGNTESFDGWRYRGSGLIQITGKSNFLSVEKATGIPCVENPTTLRTAGTASLKVAHSWWEGHVPDSVMGNPVKVRKAVNGGNVGLKDTTQLLELLQRIL